MSAGGRFVLERNSSVTQHSTLVSLKNDIGRKLTIFSPRSTEYIYIYILEIHIKIYNYLNAHYTILHSSVSKKPIRRCRRDVIHTEGTE